MPWPTVKTIYKDSSELGIPVGGFYYRKNLCLSLYNKFFKDVKRKRKLLSRFGNFS